MFTEEQERVQKKTFVNWINSYLSKVWQEFLFGLQFYAVLILIDIDFSADSATSNR